MSDVMEIMSPDLSKIIDLAKTNLNYIAQVYNVKGNLYGAKGDGVTDDTAAINRAIAAINSAGGGVLCFPRGNYLISGALTSFTTTIAAVGEGATNSAIFTNTNGIDIFTIEGYFCRVSGLGIAYTGTSEATSGSGVKLKNLNQAVIERCNIHGHYINIDTVSAAYWTITENAIYDPVKYNVRVQNTFNADEGDSQIINNNFGAKSTTDAHVYQMSSGGLRIIGNKMQHGKIGVQTDIADGVLTSILLVSANSIENQSVSFIKAGRSGTTGILAYLNITGNEFRSDAIATGIVLGDGTHTSVISSNVIHGQNTATGIQINNSAHDISIAANTFTIWETGIKLNFNSGNNARVSIGTNQFSESVIYNYKNIGYIQDSAITNDNQTMNNVVAPDNVTYINVYQIDLPFFNSAVLELDVYGIVSGFSSTSRTIKILINREGAGCVVTNVTDVAAGAAIDVNFDVATTVGSVIVKMRKAAATGASLIATVAIRVRGDVTAFKAFNTV